MNTEEQIKLKLQMFTDDPNGGAQPGDDTGGAGEGADKPQTFDAILENKEYQAEFDRRVTKAMETAKSKWETSLPDLIKAEVDKQKSYDELSDKDKEQKKINDEWARIKQAQEEIERSNLVASIRGDLAEKGLPIKVGDFDFSELFAVGDNESALQAVNAFKEAFDTAIESAVDKRLIESVDLPGGTGASKPATRSELAAEKANKQQQTKTSFWD